MSFLRATAALFRRHRLAFWLATAIFVAAALQGYTITAAAIGPAADRAAGRGVTREAVRQSLRGTIVDDVFNRGPLARIARLRGAPLALAIAVKNIMTATLSVGLGALTLGAFPLFVLLLNGYMLGAVAAAIGGAGSGAALYMLAAIAPHGVIELPTIWLATGYGLYRGGRVWRALASLAVSAPRPAPQAPGETRRLLGAVAAWLLVAAAVEAFITPAIAARVAGS